MPTPTYLDDGPWSDEENDSNIYISLHTRKGYFNIQHTSALAEEFTLEATLASHTPWNSSHGSMKSSSPEGWFINLPMPLHWHVLSPFSPAKLSLKLPASASPSASAPTDPPPEKEIQAFAHLEKNWATSWPRAHNWIQGIRIPDANASKLTPDDFTTHNLPDHIAQKVQAHTLVLAGGLIFGLEAYLCGYRNPERGISIDFRPPFTLCFLPLFSWLPLWLLAFLMPLLSPFVSAKRDWDNRKLHFSFSDLFWKLDIEASAPHDRFYDFAAPMPGGFKEKWMAQSLNGRAVVKVWRRRVELRGLRWELTAEDWFEDVGIEFGGEYYPQRGVGQEGVLQWSG